MSQRNLSFAVYDKDFKTYLKDENRKHHGGLYSIGKRKARRPLSTKKPVHLVMRSEIARGAMSLRTSKNMPKVTGILNKYAVVFDVKIYRQSINSNHVHIVLRAKTRKSFQDFLRVVAGLIARQVLGAQRGQSKGKFWDALAFSRVAEWGRAFRTLKTYVVQNVLEAAGVIAYTPRKKSYDYS